MEDDKLAELFKDVNSPDPEKETWQTEEEHPLVSAVKEATENEDPTIARRLKMRKKWKPLWKELEEATKEERKLHNKHKRLHRKFWHTVEEDLDVTCRMKYDRENDEIILFDDGE